MTASQAFVGIDAGTTGCTVMIFDENGNRLGQGYQEYPCTSPRAGWIEQDAEQVWDGICAASKTAVGDAALPASAYKSVGFSSQRGTILMLDENKRNLVPSMVWNDGRALKYQEEFGKEISPEDYQTHTGMQLSPLWSAAKIAWLRDNNPDVFGRTRWFANGQEYFLYRMGASEWVTDPASLTLNGMMEIGKLDWSDRILALCGIDRDRVPPVGIPSGQAGTLSAQAAAETGLPEGIPICRGAGDQQCAAIGAGVVHQGAAEFTVGTAGVMVAHLDSLDRIQGRNLWWGGHAVPGAWDIEGGAFSLGASLKWWRDNLGANEQIVAQEAGTSVYSVMVDKALTAPAGANGLLFHSFLASQVTPYYDAASRGGWLGLGLYHDARRHDPRAARGLRARDAHGRRRVPVRHRRRHHRPAADRRRHQVRRLRPDHDRHHRPADQGHPRARVHGVRRGDPGRVRLGRVLVDRRGRGRDGERRGRVRAERLHQGALRRGERHLPGHVRGDRERRAVREARTTSRPGNF